MAQITVPSIDNNICTGWTEQQIDLYNKLPFYLVKMQLYYMKTWSVWPKLVGKIKWQPNMGTTMRRVSKEPSPHLRQFAFPNAICDAPLKDVMDVRERTVDASVNWHQFESLIMNYCPDFRDFMTDHVMRTAKDINEKQIRYNDVFIRGNIFHQSPYVFLPNKVNGELVTAPMGNGNTAGTSGKTTAFLQANLPLIGNPGNLSVNAINLCMNIMETDFRMLPFSGSQMNEDAPPDGKYVLVISGEAYNQFIYDPWVLANKNIQLDVVKETFKGDLFGRITCKLEDMPIRIKADGTFPAPEVRELNPDAFNYGESVPNPDYVNAPYEVAFMVSGMKGYSAIEVGAPPKEFAGRGMPEGFGKMFWNGEQEITKNLILPCNDADGNRQYDTNKYGRYLQIISAMTFGIVGEQKRSIIPIIFKRWRGAHNS